MQLAYPIYGEFGYGMVSCIDLLVLGQALFHPKMAAL